MMNEIRLSDFDDQLMIYIFISLSFLICLAYFTNPTDQSFHDHLNQLLLNSIKSNQNHSKPFKSKPEEEEEEDLKSNNQIFSFKLSTPTYFKLNFFLGTLIFIKSNQSLITSTSNFNTFLGCFGSWFTFTFDLKFNLQSWNPNWKSSIIKINALNDDLSNQIDWKLSLDRIESNQTLQSDSYQGFNSNQSSISEIELTDNTTEDDESQFKDSQPNQHVPYKEEPQTKQNSSNLKSINTHDSQRIEFDERKVLISSIDPQDLSPSSVSDPTKLVSKPIRKDNQMIDPTNSKLMIEEQEEVEKVQILSIEEEFNQSNPTNLTPKQKRMKSKSKSKSHQDQNERVPISETEIKLNVELNSIQFKKNEEDLKKLHFKSSLKHLNEIKDLKEFKRRNLNEKLNQFKLMHNNLIIKSNSYQNDLKALDFKEDCIKFSYQEDFKLIETEEIKLKLDLDKMEDEIDNLNGKYEEKQNEVESLKESLKEKKLKLKLKQQSKNDSVVQGSDSIEIKPKVVKIHPNPNRPRSNTNSNSNPNPKIDEIKSNQKTHRSNHPFKSLSTSNQDLSNLNLIHQDPMSRPPMDFIPIIQSIPNPTLDPWEPISTLPTQDPWTEEIQEHIKDNFSTLPNLERSLISKSKSTSFSFTKPPMKNSIDFKFGSHSNLIPSSHSSPSSVSPFGPIGSSSNSTTSSPIIHHGLNPLPSQLLLYSNSLSSCHEFGSSSSNFVQDSGFLDPKPASRLERLKKSNRIQDHSIWDSNSVDSIHQTLLPNLFSSDSFGQIKSKSDLTESLQPIKIRRSDPISISSSIQTTLSEPSSSTSPKKMNHNPSLSLNPFAKSFEFEGMKHSRMKVMNESKDQEEEDLKIRKLKSLIDDDWIDDEEEEEEVKEELRVKKEIKENQLKKSIEIRIGIGKFGAIGCSRES